MQQEINQQFKEFIEDYNQRLNALGINLSDHILDHICYRTSNLDEYKSYYEVFKQISIIIACRIHNSRRFNCFVLKVPFEHDGFRFHYVEFSEPGGSDSYDLGFQHIEIITNTKLLELGNKLEIEKLLFNSKNGESYLKWPDKVTFKTTLLPMITKILTAENLEKVTVL